MKTHFVTQKSFKKISSTNKDESNFNSHAIVIRGLLKFSVQKILFAIFKNGFSGSSMDEISTPKPYEAKTSNANPEKYLRITFKAEISQLNHRHACEAEFNEFHDFKLKSRYS